MKIIVNKEQRKMTRAFYSICLIKFFVFKNFLSFSIKTPSFIPSAPPWFHYIIVSAICQRKSYKNPSLESLRGTDVFIPDFPFFGIRVRWHCTFQWIRCSAPFVFRMCRLYVPYHLYSNQPVWQIRRVIEPLCRIAWNPDRDAIAVVLFAFVIIAKLR